MTAEPLAAENDLHDRVSITFLLPSMPTPSGGLIAQYELANALSRRRDNVTIAHVPSMAGRISDTAEIAWFTFDEHIRHQFLSNFDITELPVADVIAHPILLVLSATRDGASTAERKLLADLHAPDCQPAGLPLLFVQGFGVFPETIDTHAFRLPCPKVCVSRWLTTLLEGKGIPPAQAVYVPNGVDHGKYRITRPVDQRPARIATNHNVHPIKGPRFAATAIAEVQSRNSGVDAIAFGSTPRPLPDLPATIPYLPSPRQAEIVEEVYNNSSIFVVSSLSEGFGMCAVEAMACGCALVTTANGGSEEYAVHGETALVCQPGDADALADCLTTLLRDDEQRIRIANNGAEFVKRFSWDASAAQLAAVVRRYRSDPEPFRVQS